MPDVVNTTLSPGATLRRLAACAPMTIPFWPGLRNEPATMCFAISDIFTSRAGWIPTRESRRTMPSADRMAAVAKIRWHTITDGSISWTMASIRFG